MDIENNFNLKSLNISREHERKRSDIREREREGGGKRKRGKGGREEDCEEMKEERKPPRTKDAKLD